MYYIDYNAQISGISMPTIESYYAFWLILDNLFLKELFKY